MHAHGTSEVNFVTTLLQSFNCICKISQMHRYTMKKLEQNFIHFKNNSSKKERGKDLR